MTELAELLSRPSGGSPSMSFRRARVISVSGRSLRVDLNTGQDGIVIPSLDSCNPIPNQGVLILVDGSSMLAVGAIGGVYRQATMIAVSSTATTVTGLVNGVSKAVTKAGSFTVTNGDELPLQWAEDASEVWVLGKAGVPYVPPVSGGGGSGGGGGTTPSTYTTSYAAIASGWFDSTGHNRTGALGLVSGGFGYFGYGVNRLNELQGKTIVSGRVYLPRLSGSGTVTVSVDRGGFEQPGSNAIDTGGWGSLPLTRLNSLISGSGSASLFFRGLGTLKGIPAGTVQITWK